MPIIRSPSQWPGIRRIWISTGLWSISVISGIDGLLRRAGLPTEAPKVGAARALELMRMDKKVLSGKVRLVLLERLGSGIVLSKYPQRTLESTLREHLA